jgi:hypothetical protein
MRLTRGCARGATAGGRRPLVCHAVSGRSAERCLAELGIPVRPAQCARLSTHNIDMATAHMMLTTLYLQPTVEASPPPLPPPQLQTPLTCSAMSSRSQAQGMDE